MTVKMATKKEMSAVARDLVRPELESVEYEIRNLNRRLDAAIREADKGKRIIETEVVRRKVFTKRYDDKFAAMMRKIAGLENSRNGK